MEKREGLFSAHSPRDVVYHSREGMEAGVGSGWSHCTHSQEDEGVQEVGLGYKTWRSTPSGEALTSQYSTTFQNSTTSWETSV